jgi:hypothetical protein
MLGARRRGPLGLVALLLAGIACLLASIPSWAGAQAPPDPQSDTNPTTTNIPYLAWRGENIRLVKCSDDLQERELNVLRDAAVRRGEFLFFVGVDFDFVLEEWGSDTARDPSPITSSSGFFFAGNKICVRETWTSSGAGLARIKLAVNVDTTSVRLPRDEVAQAAGLNPIFAILQRSHLLQHQFLAGWMTLSDPAITELPLGGDGPNDAGNPLGSGVLNTFWADTLYEPDPGNQGVIQAKVTGTLPVEGEFEGAFRLGKLKMPDAWPQLAARFATDENPNNENPSNRWDIHDQSDLGSFTTEGHPYDALPHNPSAPTCDPLDRPVNLAPGILDAVDNCAGGYAFSRVFDADGSGALPPVWLGLSDDPTRGPFDPQREDATLLPDGLLTADDAPMPSARIDFTIARNKDIGKPLDQQKDIDGVGSFRKTDKDELYSAKRPANANGDRVGDNQDPHELYAPFYSAYVPATGAPAPEASGTDGLPGNNFNGYLVGDHLGGEGDYSDDDRRYDYWDFAHEFPLRRLAAYETRCLRREDQQPDFRLTPEGPQKVAIYTDEHGIGHVNFEPGSGFWFDALLNTQPDLGNNLNGGCDLKYLKDGVLGHAEITADSLYPNQPVSAQPVGSASLTKTVKSLFAKYLAVYPKGTTSELRNARIVVAHAQDIGGEPFAYETVCFSNTSASGAIHAFVPMPNNNLARKVGPYELLGSLRVDDPVNSQDSDRVCVRTNEHGNAAIEVLESQGAEINIIGDFTAERILRDVHIPFGEPTPSVIDPGIPPRAPGAPSSPSGPPAPNANGNTTPSAAVLAQLAQNNVQVSSSRSRRAVRARVRFARVVNSARGTRYLSLRLAGSRGTAAVRIQLLGYNGKVVRTLNRTVAVGRTVRLRNVRLGANVRSVRVSVLNR